jgi:hypothetical protein
LLQIDLVQVAHKNRPVGFGRFVRQQGHRSFDRFGLAPGQSQKEVVVE